MLDELKPFNFKEYYLENDRDEENFEEILAMKNLIIPKRKSLIPVKIKTPKGKKIHHRRAQEN
jgi:hypothetical protein